nr:glycoside hydrolase family 97 N-terminal domain-containing protein [Xanthomonas campestris pv. campestris]
MIVRVYDDGLGLRYHFPAQAGLREAIIDEEVTEFAIAQPSEAWWIPAGEPIHYEYLYQRTPLNEVALAHTPLTLRSRNGLHVALHEAALVDYAGMWLRRTEGQRLRATSRPPPRAGRCAAPCPSIPHGARCRLPIRPPAWSNPTSFSTSTNQTPWAM